MEETKSHLLAALAIIDRELDELEEEFGDLPEKVQKQENTLNDAVEMVNETEQILSDVKEFCSVTKNTLKDLKVKEEKLSKQQFQVRNNKEFDAITSEIKHVKEEHKMLTEKLRQETIKQENLERILEEQANKSEDAKTELKEIKEEMSEVSEEQDNEKKVYNKLKKDLVKKMDDRTLGEYNRVREYFKDAAVPVRRNSCSGCYSAIPPQIIVEMRNDFDTTYKCENCGRILIPEDVEFDESLLEEI